MTFTNALRNLVPEELREAATARDLSQFLTLYGDTLFLVVRLRTEDAELAAGLGAMGTRAELGSAVKPVIKSMSYRTHIQPTPLAGGYLDAKGTLPGAAPELVEALEHDRHFCLPLRKRAAAEALYPDRISVGRAPNKDIVLRHVSVSKFHGWFEMDDEGSFYIADAGSKNATHVNGQAIVSREPTPIAPGDILHFGSVECLLCSPRTLWTALSGIARRTA
jgi:hypothetical protein